MYSQETTIVNKLGLHARAAAQMVKLANRYKSRISVSKGSHSANAKTIMEVLMLAGTQGTPVTVTAEGADEAEAGSAVVQLIDERFNESE